MKPIALEIDANTQSYDVNKNGDFSFIIYATNQCDAEIEQAIDTLKLIWDAPVEASLSLNLTLKGVYKDVHESYCRPDGTIHPEEVRHFTAIRKDCQWIIDHIDALEALK